MPIDGLDWKDIAWILSLLVSAMWAIIGTLGFFWLKFVHQRIDLKADKESVKEVRDELMRAWQHMGEWSSNLNNSIETWRVGQQDMRDRIAANHLEVMTALGNKQDREANNNHSRV